MLARDTAYRALQRAGCRHGRLASQPPAEPRVCSKCKLQYSGTARNKIAGARFGTEGGGHNRSAALQHPAEVTPCASPPSPYPLLFKLSKRPFWQPGIPGYQEGLLLFLKGEVGGWW